MSIINDNIDLRLDNGDTLLHNAIKNNDPELVWALIITGANIDLKDKDNKSITELANKSENRLIKEIVDKAKRQNLEKKIKIIQRSSRKIRPEWQKICGDSSLAKYDKLVFYANKLSRLPSEFRRNTTTKNKRKLCAELAKDYEERLKKQYFRKGPFYEDGTPIQCNNEEDISLTPFSNLANWKIIPIKEDESNVTYCFNIDDYEKFGIHPYTRNPLPNKRSEIEYRKKTKIHEPSYNPIIDESGWEKLSKIIVNTARRYKLFGGYTYYALGTEIFVPNYRFLLYLKVFCEISVRDPDFAPYKAEHILERELAYSYALDNGYEFEDFWQWENLLNHIWYRMYNEIGNTEKFQAHAESLETYLSAACLLILAQFSIGGGVLLAIIVKLLMVNILNY